MVSKLIGAFLGGDDDEVSPEDFATLLDKPDLVIRLKEIETTHAAKLQELAIEAERIRLADVASARSRQVESEQATGKRDINLYALAWVNVVGFFAILVLLATCPLPVGVSEILLILVGTLVAKYGSIVDYFFGSSKSSADKTTLLTAKKSTE